MEKHTVIFDYGFGEAGLGGYIRDFETDKIIMFIPEKERHGSYGKPKPRKKK